ncbi:MAG: transcriptional regulator, TrmB [Subtercola sp.]|nr:transcriptional regulator, TrmB [Subtercola sp.]
MDAVTDPAANAPHSQTLSRGIRVLEVLADSDGTLTIAELAAALDVHRSIVYRILRTLEDHGLVVRDASGGVSLGPRMATLARGVERNLQSAALPELTEAANELGMTTFLVVLEHLECVTLLSVEPRANVATVAQRPGTRHSLAVGAPGLAIQSLLTDRELAEHGDVERRDDAGAVGSRGYASSHDEVIAGLRSVAVPLAVPGSPRASIAVVYVASAIDEAEIGRRLVEAAAAIRAASA